MLKYISASVLKPIWFLLLFILFLLCSDKDMKNFLTKFADTLISFK